mmetsp:Transcript_15923/g.34452  ORF Transcript_15923/g.34452 Transcript_15923/m.34452 type:complete len:94 (-) Transcript_15923:551-832(-)
MLYQNNEDLRPQSTLDASLNATQVEFVFCAEAVALAVHCRSQDAGTDTIEKERLEIAETVALGSQAIAPHGVLIQKTRGLRAQRVRTLLRPQT